MFCRLDRVMAMGTRKKRERQESLWYGSELPPAPGHPFYSRLNEVLEKADFDRFCEKSCAGFYHAKLGHPSLAPGLYFRILMIGFFEGIDSERGIAWRMADSLTLRQFLFIGLDEQTADHVMISRTRRLIGAETHQLIFTWVLERLAKGGLIKGKTIGVDSMTLEANAAMKSIVRRDTGESYSGYSLRRSPLSFGHIETREVTDLRLVVTAGGLLTFIVLSFPTLAASLAGMEVHREHLRLEKRSENRGPQRTP
jgi:transposase